MIEPVGDYKGRVTVEFAKEVFVRFIESYNEAQPIIDGRMIRLTWDEYEPGKVTLTATAVA